MILQRIADANKLLIYFGHNFFKLINVLRCTNTGNNVFALCVHQELTKQLLLTSCRVTRKGNARTGRIAHVTKSHHLYVNRRTPGIRNIIVAAVNIGAGVVPGTENRLNSAHQLLFGIRGEIRADFALIFSLKLICQLFQILGSQLNILLNALFLFHLVNQLFKILFADFHNNVGIHLYKSSVAVPSPSGIVGFLCNNLNNFFIQAQVQNGIHHTRHGSARTGANRNQKGIFLIAELFAGDALHLFDILHNLRLNLIVDLLPVLIVLGAGFG